jgi:hypothetical protein
LASHLHSHEAVTVSGSFNGSCAPVADSPISPAPDAGTPREPGAFGQQLQDARQVSPSTELAGWSTGPKRAGGRGAIKNLSDEVDGFGFPAVPAALPPADTRPFSFSFALLAPAGQSTGLPQTFTGEQPTPTAEAIPQSAPEASAPQLLSQDLAFAVKAVPKQDAAPQQVVETPAGELAGQGKSQAAAGRPSDGSAGIFPSESPAHVAPVKDKEASDGPGPQPEKPAAPVVETLFRSSVSTPDAHAEAAAPPRPTEVPQAAEPPVKPAEPLKQLSIQVGDSQQQRVELRVVERSGELQVSVRSASPEVTQGLRQGLSELVGRLDQSGFHAEAWRPGATAGVQGTVETRQESAQFQNNGSQGQPSSQQQSRQQGNQHQSPRPQWVEELEGSLTGRDQSSTGESYGISR